MVAALLIVALLVKLAAAWWDNGHMLTAEIARQQLTVQEVDKLNSILRDWDTDFPGACDAVTAAVWPDLIKCEKVSPNCRKSQPDDIRLFDDWHFDGKPYNPEHLQLPADAVNWAIKGPSASWTLTEAMGTFGLSKSRFAFNLMLRFVIHIVGDLHQPLHSGSGYFKDTQFGSWPQGDQGGNLIQVKTGLPGVTNLHMFWDACAGLYMVSWPPNDATRRALTLNASTIMARYPKDSGIFKGRYSGPRELDDCWRAALAGQARKGSCLDAFNRWDNDTFAVLAQYAYKGVTADGPLSAEYISTAKDVVQQQLALGGYRLADFLRLALSQAPARPQAALAAREPGTEWTTTARALLGVSCALGTVCAGLLALLVCPRRSVRAIDGTELREAIA